MVFCILKTFFEFSPDSPGFDTQADFSKADRTKIISGLFDEQDPVGMLEAYDIQRIDEVLPFLGALVDVLSENENEDPVTKLLSMYSDPSFLLVWCLQSLALFSFCAIL